MAITKKTTISYIIKCDNCGLKIEKEEVHNNKIPSNSYVNQYYSGLLNKLEEKEVEMPNTWYKIKNGQIVCSEACLLEINKKNYEKYSQENLEEYRKQLLNNLRK